MRKALFGAFFILIFSSFSQAAYAASVYPQYCYQPAYVYVYVMCPPVSYTDGYNYVMPTFVESTGSNIDQGFNSNTGTWGGAVGSVNTYSASYTPGYTSSMPNFNTGSEQFQSNLQTQATYQPSSTYTMTTLNTGGPSAQSAVYSPYIPIQNTSFGYTIYSQ